MNQEKGFVYPVTLIMCMLILQVLIYQVSLYMTEKQAVYEQERLMQIETLLQLGISDFLNGEYDPVPDKKILFSYPNGTVTLSIETYLHGISNISVKADLETGHERIAGFQYNWSNKVLDNYWEVS
ncbi:competence type IV pilus minor pilin ComGG [Halalkalibacter flavus]|jgi:competence protein ComGG|uniref:competence type IV pilus minor pilin ComGG n=1 Tax=Halalkalibacter flavus TaxID=3090668 RepID=UPI002FCC2CE8